MSAILTVEMYNKNRLSIRGDRTRYNDIIKSIGGRWNPRMHGGEGWIIPIEKNKILFDSKYAITADEPLSHKAIWVQTKWI